LKKDGLESAIKDFDFFMDTLNCESFKKKPQRVKEYQQRKIDYASLIDLYIKSVSHFYVAFNNNIESASMSIIRNEVIVTTSKAEAIHSQHDPYFNLFQKLSTQFLAIHENCSGKVLSGDFMTIEGTKDNNHKVGLFKDDSGYVPFPITSKVICSYMPIHYGAHLFPQKSFLFYKGLLVKDSGIVLTPGNDHLKLNIQYGEFADNPFTSHSRSRRIPYGSDFPLMHALQAQFGEDLVKGTHFITIPTTSMEEDILELLFLEDLIEEKQIKQDILQSEGDFIDKPSQRFLTWIESEIKSETQSDTSLEDKLKQLEERIIDASEKQQTQQDALIVENSPPDSFQEAESIGKDKGKRKAKSSQKGSKGGKDKKFKKKQGKSVQVDNTPPPQSHAKEKERVKLIEKVKQEGRVKFKRILGIMNTIRSKASDEKILNKFTAIGTRGSHINFHMENSEGLTLVKKHGGKGSTYSADVVNRFSARLINAIFSSPNE
jgi:hypothetical protein